MQREDGSSGNTATNAAHCSPVKNRDNRRNASDFFAKRASVRPIRPPRRNYPNSQRRPPSVPVAPKRTTKMTPVPPKRTTPIPPFRHKRGQNQSEGRMLQSIASATNVEQQSKTFFPTEDDADCTTQFDGDLLKLRTAVASGSMILPTSGVYIFSNIKQCWFRVISTQAAPTHLGLRERSTSAPVPSHLHVMASHNRVHSNPAELSLEDQSGTLRRSATCELNPRSAKLNETLTSTVSEPQTETKQVTILSKPQEVAVHPALVQLGLVDVHEAMQYQENDVSERKATGPKPSTRHVPTLPNRSHEPQLDVPRRKSSNKPTAPVRKRPQPPARTTSLIPGEDTSSDSDSSSSNSGSSGGSAVDTPRSGDDDKETSSEDKEDTNSDSDDSSNSVDTPRSGDCGNELHKPMAPPRLKIPNKPTAPARKQRLSKERPTPPTRASRRVNPPDSIHSGKELSKPVAPTRHKISNKPIAPVRKRVSKERPLPPKRSPREDTSDSGSDGEDVPDCALARRSPRSSLDSRSIADVVWGLALRGDNAALERTLSAIPSPERLALLNVPRGSDDSVPLRAAVANRDKRCVQLLLDMKASPVVAGCLDNNPLEDARALRYMDIVEILEDALCVGLGNATGAIDDSIKDSAVDAEFDVYFDEPSSPFPSSASADLGTPISPDSRPLTPNSKAPPPVCRRVDRPPDRPSKHEPSSPFASPTPDDLGTPTTPNSRPLTSKSKARPPVCRRADLQPDRTSRRAPPPRPSRHSKGKYLHLYASARQIQPRSILKRVRTARAVFPKSTYQIDAERTVGHMEGVESLTEVIAGALELNEHNDCPSPYAVSLTFSHWSATRAADLHSELVGEGLYPGERVGAPLLGFTCPECMLRYDSQERLQHHYTTTHSEKASQELSSMEHLTSKSTAASMLTVLYRRYVMKVHNSETLGDQTGGKSLGAAAPARTRVGWDEIKEHFFQLQLTKQNKLQLGPAVGKSRAMSVDTFDAQRRSKRLGLTKYLQKKSLTLRQKRVMCGLPPVDPNQKTKDYDYSDDEDSPW